MEQYCLSLIYSPITLHFAWIKPRPTHQYSCIMTSLGWSTQAIPIFTPYLQNLFHLVVSTRCPRQPSSFTHGCKICSAGWSAHAAPTTFFTHGCKSLHWMVSTRCPLSSLSMLNNHFTGVVSTCCPLPSL